MTKLVSITVRMKINYFNIKAFNFHRKYKKDVLDYHETQVRFYFRLKQKRIEYIRYANFACHQRTLKVIRTPNMPAILTLSLRIFLSFFIFNLSVKKKENLTLSINILLRKLVLLKSIPEPYKGFLSKYNV